MAPICAKPVYLQCPPVVQVSGNRTPDNGNAHDFLPVRKSYGKLVAYNRPVVPVVLLYKGVCLFQRHRYNLKHFCTSFAVV